jgi:arylformamidase
MKIYDISQDVFNCKIYADDPHPQKQILKSMQNGDTYNLTAFSMCAHNGTHIDAPAHFIENGATVDMIPLTNLVGYAFVVEYDTSIDANAAEDIIRRAAKINNSSAMRILIKGQATVTAEAADVFVKRGVVLVGTESQSVGPEDAPAEVHRILLSASVTLLEGIRLGECSEGIYFLCCAPILLSGSDGAPCRAILIGND